MVMGIIVIVGIALLAWIWASRGLFSALLHMVCVIMAGAIAFAVWEPVSYALLGTKQQWLIDVAWGLGLALPFAVSLAVIRVTMDKLVPANVDLDTVTNFVGGAACGAVSGVFTMGILAISLSYTRLPTDMGHLDYRSVNYHVSGSLVRKSSLFLPVDRITAGFYGLLSETTFRPIVGEPLAKWHPELASEGGLLRTNFDNGRSRAFLPPDYISIIGRYTVARATQGANILADSFGPDRGTRTGQAVYLDSRPVNPAQAYLEGFVVKLEPAAKERFGATVIGSGQVWLLLQHEQTGDTKMILPLAMISRAKGETDQLGRWLFNRPDVFIPSVGGGSESVFAFEFPVERGWRPLALSVKGTRTDVSQMQAGNEYDTTAARDAAVRDGSIISLPDKVAFDWSRAGTVRVDPNILNAPIRVGNGFPGRMSVQKDRRQNLQINDQNEVTGGEQKFPASELEGLLGVERSLLVNRFFAGPGYGIVQVDISHNNPGLSLTKQPVLQSQSQDTSKPLYLVDALGRAYEPVGYVYKAPTRGEIWIRFTPGAPIRKISDLPRGGPATVQPDDEYTLIYRLPNGVQIRGFAVGSVVGAQFSPQPEIGPPR